MQLLGSENKKGASWLWLFILVLFISTWLLCAEAIELKETTGDLYYKIGKLQLDAQRQADELERSNHSLITQLIENTKQTKQLREELVVMYQKNLATEQRRGK